MSCLMGDTVEVSITFRGSEYPGSGESEAEAVGEACRLAAGATGAMLADVMTAYYGDTDCEYQDGFAAAPAPAAYVEGW